MIAEQVLTIMEVILLEAINEPTDKDKVRTESFMQAPSVYMASDK